MRLVVLLFACWGILLPHQLRAQDGQRQGERVLKVFLQDHCLDCHDAASKTAGLELETLLSNPIARHPAVWESVVRKLSTRQMPPIDMPRPDEKSYRQVVSMLTTHLDMAIAKNPVTGRSETFRRMNRTEYQNAIRDLLDLEIDVAEWLPADESSHGFDNITVTGLTPVLLTRYISAAQKISRLAIGNLGEGTINESFRMRPDVTQDKQRVRGLPLGTRGGMLLEYHFPQDGEYEIRVRLMRDRNDEIEGLRGKHELQVLLDRDLKAKFEIARPAKGKSDTTVESKLKTRFNVNAGPHSLGVTFVKKSVALDEGERQPLNVHYNFYRHPRLGPAVYQVSIAGPFKASGPGLTPSRRKVFICRPENKEEELDCAKRILSRLTRRAYRRPVTESDLEMPLKFYEAGKREGGFDVGIEKALAAILVNPNFLFRIERQPTGLKQQRPYRISDIELASRLSFFLWSSIPDEQLLSLAESKELSKQEVLESQVRRMLKDKRSQTLVTNFADQWLYLRNLDSFVPDARLYPDFGHNLRQAFRRETELLFEEVLREDKSIMTLLNSKATYLNERLARHYGIPNVHGSHFRRVRLDESIHGSRQRGGILRHASVLSVTSYATRTSPVLRGKWILENLMGSPPPPPPDNIPALEDNSVAADLPVRKRLAAHRANVACAACHDLIDPIGFGLENYDAIGRWRVLEGAQAVDATGALPDGSRFEGVAELEKALLQRPHLFARTLSEKLLTFALGRGVEYYDAPAIRKVVEQAKADDYRFSSLVIGIVTSMPFQSRMAEFENEIKPDNKIDDRIK